MDQDYVEALATSAAVLDVLPDSPDPYGGCVCPTCGSQDVSVWADDGSTDDADWAECNRCGFDSGAVNGEMGITHPIITDAESIRDWFDALLDQGFNFHPEDDPGDMVNYKTMEPCFTDREAARMNYAMQRCYQIHHDPCEIACDSMEAYFARPENQRVRKEG